MLFHKHLLINAKVNNPMNKEEEAISFLNDLVTNIDMKILQGPFSTYVDKAGNRGLTAIVMIETSHVAFHIWDEQSPGTLQFDLYTCGKLELPKVMETLKKWFTITSLDYRLYDREVGFTLEDEGSLS